MRFNVKIFKLRHMSDWLSITHMLARFFCDPHLGWREITPLTREVIISGERVHTVWCRMSSRNRPLLSCISSSCSANHKSEAADLSKNPLR